MYENPQHTLEVERRMSAIFDPGSDLWVRYRGRFRDRVATIVRRGLDDAERIHVHQTRKRDGSPYILHPIEIIEKYAQMTHYEEMRGRDILILALHDTIEDHPEHWQHILDTYGVKVFRDVLILSTGGIPKEVRTEIWEHFDHQFPDWTEASMGSPFFDIRHILSPAPPLFKLRNYSRYTEDLENQETQKIEKAFLYYQIQILGESVDPDDSHEELVSLAHYIYFTPQDTRRKFFDMINNMKDAWEMERMKPGYIQKRRIKAYLLSVKLRNFGLNEEFSELVRAFQDLEEEKPPQSDELMHLPTDADISAIISEAHPSRVEV